MGARGKSKHHHNKVARKVSNNNSKATDDDNTTLSSNSKGSNAKKNSDDRSRRLTVKGAALDSTTKLLIPPRSLNKRQPTQPKLSMGLPSTPICMFVQTSHQEYAQNLVGLKVFNKKERIPPLEEELSHPEEPLESSDDNAPSDQTDKESDVESDDWWDFLASPRWHFICLAINLLLLCFMLLTSHFASQMQQFTTALSGNAPPSYFTAKSTLPVDHQTPLSDHQVVEAVPPVLPSPPLHPDKFTDQPNERKPTSGNRASDEKRKTELDKLLFHKKVQPPPTLCHDGVTIGYSSWSALRDAVHHYNDLYHAHRKYALSVPTDYASWIDQEPKLRPKQKPPPPSFDKSYARDKQGRIMRYQYEYNMEDEVDSYYIDPDTGDILYDGRGLDPTFEQDHLMQLARQVYVAFPSLSNEGSSPLWQMLPAYHPLSYPPPDPFVICPGATLSPSTDYRKSTRRGWFPWPRKRINSGTMQAIFVNAPQIKIHCDACVVSFQSGTHFTFGPDAKDVWIVGLTLMGATTSSLLFHHDGADVSFEDCTWLYNDGGLSTISAATKGTTVTGGTGAVADFNSTSSVSFYRCEISDSKQRLKPGNSLISGQSHMTNKPTGSSLTIRN